MFNNKKILAFIPARSGSKRIINKNIKLFGNKPLFMHSVDVAKKCSYIDAIAVSTNSEEIYNLAIQSGCLNCGLRPENLCKDNSKTITAIINFRDTYKEKYDVVVLLQPTSPLRTAEMLNKAIELYFQNNEKSVITVFETDAVPIFIRTLKNGNLKKLLKNKRSDIRSQNFKKLYQIIGSIYVNNLKKLTKNTILNENKVPFVIDKKYCVDIDTNEDWIKAENLLKDE